MLTAGLYVAGFERTVRGDDALTAVAREHRPQPAHDGHEPVAPAEQVADVDDGPHEQSEAPAEAERRPPRRRHGCGRRPRGCPCRGSGTCRACGRLASRARMTRAAWRPCCIAAGATPGRPYGGHVADREHVRRGAAASGRGRRRSGRRRRARACAASASTCASGDGATPAAHSTVRACDAVAVGKLEPVRRRARRRPCRGGRRRRAAEVPRRPAPRGCREVRQQLRADLEQRDRGLRRVDVR